MTASRIIDGRFALLERLGSGEDGTVYAAELLSTGRRVALKLLHAPLAHHHLELARRAARVAHDSVVEILDLGTDASGTCFVMMELVEGEPLDELIATRGPLPPLLAAELVLEVLAALDAAHAIGVGHRGLRPESILVTDPDEPRIKLLHLGAARVNARRDVIDAAEILRAIALELPLALTAAIDDVYSTGDLELFAHRLARFIHSERRPYSFAPTAAGSDPLGREFIPESVLERPRFPRPPQTPRDAVLLAAMPVIGDALEPSERVRRQATTLPAATAKRLSRACRPSSSWALWATAGGCAFGLAAWAAGLL